MSDIIVGSVGVRLVPNAEGFSAKAKALTKGLTANVKADLDDKEAKAKVENLGRPRKSKVKAEADTAEASAKLDRAARTRKAKIEADVSGLDRVTRALDGVPKGMGVLGTSIAAFGPALIPVTAAVGGLTAALAAPIAAGVGGLGLYGFIAGKAIADTEKQSKAIDQLKKKVDAAQVSLAKASTPAGKKSALATLAVDTKAYNDALGKLSPAQAGFIKAQGQVVSAFHTLEHTSGPAIFGPLTDGMKTIATLLPKVGPVLRPVSAALTGLLDDVGRSARSGALNDFMKFLASAAGPTITTAGYTLGNIALGFAAIGKAFAPLGAHLGDTILHWSESFAKIGQSKNLSGFVSYVQQNGPQVAHTLGDLAGAVGHLVEALAPIGHISLSAIDGLAKGISKIPTGALTVAAGAFAGIALSMKAIGLAKGGLSALSTVAKFAGIGGKAGALGAAEGARGKVAGKGVVPVFVTNEGFGGKPGVGGGGGNNIPGGGPRGITGGGALIVGGAIASQVLPDTLNNLDSLIRSHAKNIGESTATIKRALVDSNVGKHAAEFGIDLDKLATQMQKFGSNAPYVKQVQKRLENQFSIGGAFAGALPGVNTKTERSSNAEDDLVRLAKARDVDIAKTKQQVQAQAGLNTLLLSPALPKYAAQLQTLPKKVQTEIATPGAVTSLADVSRLAQKYNLTPKQVRTLIELANAGKVKADATTIGRLYGLTPKQVRTLIAQVGMGSSQAQIRRLASLYNLTPKQVHTIVTASTSNAAAAIARIRSMLAGIPRSISTSYYVNQVNSVSKAPLNFSPGHQAYGGSVPKDGGPYADRYPYLLAPGEEVISNKHGQADKHRGLLKAINAGRLAGGGTARSSMLPDAGGDRRRPLFRSEGPHWYAAAYRHNRPFALGGPSHWDWPYQTSLTSREERLFEQWVSRRLVPFDPRERITDYDMRGYWRQTKGRGWHQGSHFPDTYKTPYDTTFSHESKYATRNNPFFWHGNKLIDQRNGQVIFAANGSTVPRGGPYADRYPYLLAPGEEVISNKNGQADRNRPLLKAINAGRLASGGTAGFGPWNIHNPFQNAPGGSTSGWHGAVWPQSPWGPLHASTQALNAAIKSTSASLKDHTKTLAADKTALSNLQAAAASLRTAVQGQFTGTSFNAGVQANPATGQAYVSDLQAQEQTMFTNRVTSDRFLTDLKALKKLGISGPAFLQLAQSNDVTLLDQLVEGGRGEVAHYNSLLAEQNASATRVGNYAPGVAYGAEIKAQAATNKELADSIKLLNVELARLRKDLPKHVQAGAHAGAQAGTHAGITSKAKHAQQATRNRPGGP